jgi:hypothetical protein
MQRQLKQTFEYLKGSNVFMTLVVLKKGKYRKNISHVLYPFSENAVIIDHSISSILLSSFKLLKGNPA